MVVGLELCPKAAPFVDISELDADKILEGESGRPNQDGQIAVGTLIAVTGEQISRTFNVSKKRRGTPLDDEERKERKRIADQKYRGKAKAYVKYLENELQAAKSKVERLESANELLNEAKNSNAQNVQDAATENGKLQYEINRLKATIWDQQQTLNTPICLNKAYVNDIESQLQAAVTENEKLQYEIKRLKDHVGKMEEELRGLKRINAFPMEGPVTMANDLQIGPINTSELQHKICSIVEQQLVNMFGLSC